MQLKHTRGPWHASGTVVVQPHPQATTEFAKRQGYIVARSCYATTDGEPTEETLANTRLIATAPDGYALAQHILALETDPYLQGHPEWEAFLNEAKALVNKAVRQ